jgi:hypothetical protein
MTIHTKGISYDVPESARPLTVSVKTACKVVGLGNTTMWALIKDGRGETVCIGRRR